MSMRAENYTMAQPGWPHSGMQSVTITMAVRIVRRYGQRIPSVDQIIQDFGVSRATAYRWHAALRESLDTEVQA